MQLFTHVFIIIFICNLPILHAKVLTDCRFVKTFYEIYPNIFQLNQDQTSLIVRPLYALSNQSFFAINQSLSIGIIYRLANTYLVPVPLLFECSQNERLYEPNDCEFTIIDIRVRKIFLKKNKNFYSNKI